VVEYSILCIVLLSSCKENTQYTPFSFPESAQRIFFGSSVLKDLGINKGDYVALYLPMIPEALIAMLACARIGTVHSVIFSGFSAGAISERVNDTQAKLLITADGGFRRGKIIPLKETADQAMETCQTIENVLVIG
jgi:acetyl-CoA synthetase